MRYIKSLSILLIAFAGIIVYSNSFHCSFHFDDQFSIIDNPVIKDIRHWQGIWNYWPCRFLTYISLAFNYQVNGLDVFGYHLFNLGVHLLTSLLVWWLVLLTLSTPAMKGAPVVKKDLKKSVPEGDTITHHALLIALFTGLVFVTHPLQTQAVTYIVQRAASMASMFYLASLCLYVKSRLIIPSPLRGGLGRGELQAVTSS